MKINFEQNESYDELYIELKKNILDEEVQEVLDKLSKKYSKTLIGFKEKEVFVLDDTKIFRVYSENNKTFAITQDGEYTLKNRLYELEEILDTQIFVRISNSEFVNMKKVKKFDLNLTGTIKVFLSNGDSTFVSRRYVSKIKNYLGL